MQAVSEVRQRVVVKQSACFFIWRPVFSLLEGHFIHLWMYRSLDADCRVFAVLLVWCMTQGPGFFSSCAHLFDCAVSVLCVALLVGSGDLKTLSQRPRAPPEAPDDVLRQSLTALRIATQLMRIIPLALHQKRARVRLQRNFSVSCILVLQEHAARPLVAFRAVTEKVLAAIVALVCI